MNHHFAAVAGNRAGLARFLMFLMLCAVLLFAARHSTASVSTGPTSTAPLGSNSTTLPDGKVLVTGGYTWINSTSTKLNTSELYDPASGTFTPMARMAIARERHAAVALGDGRVLVMGGYGNPNMVKLASAEIYDPVSNSWHTAGPMTAPRTEFSVHLLPDGRVLVVGDSQGNNARTTEIFDPATETFSASGTMLWETIWPAPALLDDGRVLLMGGFFRTSPTTYATSAQLWDPATGQWSATGSMNFARSSFGATTLSNGKVLVAGGRNEGYAAPAELYDPASGTFSVTGAIAAPRTQPVLHRLDDGAVLIGGVAVGGLLEPTIERYDVTSGVWTTVGKMAFPRRDHRVHTLPGGRVLSVGGTTVLAETAEIFDPICASGPSSLSAPGPAFPGNGGTGSIAVTVPNGCPWEVRRFPSWASLTSPARGVGSGTVNFTVALNSSYARGATPVIADLPYSLNQAERECQPSAVTYLSPGSVTFPAGGGSYPVRVYYDSVCSWSVGGGPAWVSVLSGASGKGDGTVNISVGQNAATAPRTASMTVGTATLQVQQQPACDTSVVNAIAPASGTFAAGGGSGTVSVTAAAGCSWNVSGAPSWVSVATYSRMGSGTVQFTVTANTQAARSATFTIAGQSYTVSQAAGAPVCDPAAVATLSAASMGVSDAASSAQVTVSYPAGCGWSVTGVPSWITITGGAPGTGSGYVTFNIAANTGNARSATLVIGGASFTVHQATHFGGCDQSMASLSSYSTSMPAGGGTGSVNVNFNGCPWSAFGAPSWVTITSATSGNGNGSVQFSVAANAGAARSATLTIAQKSYVINQAAATVTPPACVTKALTPGVPVSGTLSSSTGCSQNARGSGYYADRYSFNAVAGQQIVLALSSGAYDTYLYLKNPSGSVIAQNDDGGGGTNSRIPASSGVFTIPAGMSGTFTVEVTSYSTGGSGAYSLTYTTN